MHCVWATKERRPLIQPDLQQRLWPYFGGVARENKMKALIVGGVEDHVHVLLSVPSTLSVARAVQLLKGNSSKWIHDTFPEHWGLEWQEGYGAFSIGVSGLEATTKYIQGQAEHHRKVSFREECVPTVENGGLFSVVPDGTKTGNENGSRDPRAKRSWHAPSAARRAIDPS
jgi:REP element-mobilizing transposase RayT